MKLSTRLIRTLIPVYMLSVTHPGYTQVANRNTQIPVYLLDPSQPIEKRVRHLMVQLTLEEKATLLNHRGPTVTRFNIRSDGWNQSLHFLQLATIGLIILLFFIGPLVKNEAYHEYVARDGAVQPGLPKRGWQARAC